MNTIHCNVSNDQLSMEEWSSIESRMRPDRYSQVGFLAEDEKLSTVIEQDRQTLQHFGITYDQIADILKYIEDKYIKSSHLVALINEKYQVSSVCYMGAQECPFQNHKLDDRYHGVDYGSVDLTVKNVATGKTITFGTLLHHLIRAHHFFESPKSPYRLDPVDVIELFDLKPGVVYTPKYEILEEWTHTSSSSNIMYGKEGVEVLLSVCLEKYDTGIPGVLCMVLPCTWTHNLAKYVKENSTFDWNSYFQYEYTKDRESSIKLSLFDDYVPPTDEEILQRVNRKLKKIEQNNIEDVYVVVLNGTKKPQSFTINVRGVKLGYVDKYATVETIYRYRTYKVIQ